MRILIDQLGGATGEAADLKALYRPPRLPWLRVNMVSTLDGAANGESGTSGSINNDADKRVFRALRAQADAVVVGAGTARTERYRVADVPLVVVSHRALVPEQLRDVGLAFRRAIEAGQHDAGCPPIRVDEHVVGAVVPEPHGFGAGERVKALDKRAVVARPDDVEVKVGRKRLHQVRHALVR